MTTSEIGDIIYELLKRGSVPDVRRGWNVGRDEPTGRRAVLLVKTSTPSRGWVKTYAEVNVCVPDFKNGEANLTELAKLEAEYASLLGIHTGLHWGTRWRLARESCGLMEDASMRLHYVNIRVLFEHQNTIEQWQAQFPQST